MEPTHKEYSDMFDHMLINTPQGSPRQANMYRSYGYFADMPLIPLDQPACKRTLFDKKLSVFITLSQKGHLSKWQVLNPKAHDIEKALRSIQHGMYHSYMILKKANGHYIQTNVHTLEYRNGSSDDHYYCPPEFLTSMTILKAFWSYASETYWWKNSVQWRNRQ